LDSLLVQVEARIIRLRSSIAVQAVPIVPQAQVCTNG
jgi:hypothetical protein